MEQLGLPRSVWGARPEAGGSVAGSLHPSDTGPLFGPELNVRRGTHEPSQYGLLRANHLWLLVPEEKKIMHFMGQIVEALL